MAGLLERFDLMQKRPFGTNTALSDGTQYGVGGAVGSQYRRQEQAYGQALRLLNRQARRGNVDAALGVIKLREQAMEGGYAPGGIRQKAQADAGIMGRIGAMDARNRGLESAASSMQQDTAEKLGDGVQGASGVQGATRVEGASGVQGASREGYSGNPAPRTTRNIDPGFTPPGGLDYLGGGKNVDPGFTKSIEDVGGMNNVDPGFTAPNEISTSLWTGPNKPDFNDPRVEASGSIFSEAERKKRRQLTLEGRFGEAAKAKLEREMRMNGGILDRADARLKRFGNLA